MRRHLLQRLAFSLLSLWLLSAAVFVLMRVAPGDAVTAALAGVPGGAPLTKAQVEVRKRELGLDRPIAAQYISWAGALLRGDAGRSAVTGLPVARDFPGRLAVTLELSMAAIALVVACGVAGGTLAARYRGEWPDKLVRAAALAGLSVPGMWLGLLIILALAAWAGLFVAAGYRPLTADPGLHLRTMAVAALVLAARPAALLARVVRISVIEALSQDHVRTARAKGLGEGAVLWRHAFRSAAAPAVALAGTETVFLLGGSVIVEQLFGLPGIGRALAAGVIERDFPFVQATVMLFGGAALLASLFADLIAGWLDPRAQAAYGARRA